MGVNHYYCESCKEVYSEYSESICDLCDDHCGCEDCEFNGKFDYILDGQEYVLCSYCRPERFTIEEVKIKNENYDKQCIKIEDRIKKELNAKMKKGDTNEFIRKIEIRRKARKEY
jgi:CxxC motif-containing protein